MSGNPLANVDIPENMVRDFLITLPGIAVDTTLDVPSTGSAMGLDVFIRNRGAAALTVDLNGTGPITVDPGDVYAVNDYKIWFIEVLSAVLYDFQLFGVNITTLRRRGLMN